jgi:hypothetical protein
MSRKSPRQYAEHCRAQGRPAPAASLQQRLREHAGELHAAGSALLAQANEIERMADELDPVRVPYPGAPFADPPKAKPVCSYCEAGARCAVHDKPKVLERLCYCGAPLTFEDHIDETVGCFCEICRARALRDGSVISVYGYGRSKAEAHLDWTNRQQTM